MLSELPDLIDSMPILSDIDVQDGGCQTGSSCVLREGILDKVLLDHGIEFGFSNMDLAVEIWSQFCLEHHI